MRNLINRFFTFANGLYNIYAAKSKMKDGRQQPQIAPSAIFLSLILMVLFKKRSLLKLDQFMRMASARNFFVRDKRVAVSDSTIARRHQGKRPREIHYRRCPYTAQQLLPHLPPTWSLYPMRKLPARDRKKKNRFYLFPL